MTAPDWNPELYGRFSTLRLRPAMELLAQVGPLPEGGVTDLGCGTGVMGPALAARFPGRRLTGLDASPAMLEKARATGAYDALEEADAAGWVPEAPPALIFSNALLQWLPDHETLFPRLAGLVAPGGTLAVQMPRQYDAPSHALLRQTAEALFPGRFGFSGWRAPVAPPLFYARLLAPLGEVSVWETEYLQRLDPVAGSHPVRHFTQATAMRPITKKLDAGETARFLAAYDEALARAYPPEADGGILFPFRRLFLTFRREG